MNNFHYHQDPLYSAAAHILEGTAEVQAIVADFAVGDNTNFGKVLEIGSDSITFKAKDLPKTKISFKQRKMGSSEFLLTKLVKLKEETEVSEEGLDEAYKPLRKPEDLVAELQSIVDAPDAKLWDVTSVSIRLSHEDIFDRFPKIYDYVEDMWYAIMTPDGARKTKEIAKKAIDAVHKYYPIKEEAEETLDEAINWDVIHSMYIKDIIDVALAFAIGGTIVAYKVAKILITNYIDDKKRSKEDADQAAILKSIIDKIHRDKTASELIAAIKEVPYSSSMSAGDKAKRAGLVKQYRIRLKSLLNADEYALLNDIYNSTIRESVEAEETLDEAINWLGDYLTTSEKSQFGGYRPTIIDKKTKRLMYQSAAKYNTPDEAKDHAEDYLKQKSKGIRDPKVPIVGTYKEETEEVEEAVDPATKRRKQLDMARVNAGAMSRDDYNKKYKLGKYRPAGSKLSGPGGLYKNLVKKEALDPDADASVWIDDFVKSDDPRFEGKSKEERIKMALGAWYAAQKKESVEPTADTLEEATMTAAEKKTAERLEEVVALPSVKKVIDVIDEMTPKEYSNFLHALADNAFGIAVMARRTKPKGPSNADAWEDVADGIRDAAKAYDARPVNIYKTNECVEETLEEGVYPLTKKALDVVFAFDTYEFEQFLKVLATTFAAEGKKSGFDEMVAVANHLEKAYKIWKTREFKEDTEVQAEALQEAVYPLTKKALDATFNLDPDEFEEYLKELAKNLNNEGDDTGYDEWHQVADHIEKAHMIWKKRDPNI